VVLGPTTIADLFVAARTEGAVVVFDPTHPLEVDVDLDPQDLDDRRAAVMADTTSTRTRGADTEGTDLEDLPTSRPSERVSTAHVFTAGNVQSHINDWENITSDNWVLDVIRNGYEI
jgi:hypothetical protein